MKVEQRFLLWMRKTVMLPLMIVRITFERVNCSEVGGRGEKFYCEYLEYEFAWST